MDDVDRLYRRLKGVRARLKLQAREIERAVREGDLDKLRSLEERIIGLAYTKTCLRKEFEKRIGIRGPYKLTTR
ncbi:MAG: hypothetical protein DRJ97_02700 [Thermoprotei archaeon]|nr:MAG: hypothetical protein DRJ97_02700 [Thermoprotei archaeon]